MKLLVAIDDSACSLAAIARVSSSAWSRGASVLLLTVVPAAAYLGAEFFVPVLVEFETLLREETGRAEAKLFAIAADLRRRGLIVATRVLRGDPRCAIVDSARDEDVDLVVVGSHGRTGLKRLALGSVAAHVVTHASMDVLVVRRTRV